MPFNGNDIVTAQRAHNTEIEKKNIIINNDILITRKFITGQHATIANGHCMPLCLFTKYRGRKKKFKNA